MAQLGHQVFVRIQLVNMPICRMANNLMQEDLKIKFVELPFYQIEKEILKPMILPVDEGNDGFFKRCSINFEVPTDVANSLLNSPNDATPHYELQLRFALYNVHEEQPDHFPNEIKMTMNELKVNLPSKIKTQLIPGQSNPIKRESKPVNLTAYYVRNLKLTQELKIEWQQDSRQFVIGIWLVKHINLKILRDQFIQKGELQYAKTRMMIKKRLANDDDELVEQPLKASLLCPYSHAKMNIPVKSKNCSHIQCFDLDNYLRMNKKKPGWKCPICNGKCSYSSLVIDQYFLEVIQSVSHDTVEVELLQNGKWRVEENQINTTTTSTTHTTRQIEVITLEESNENAQAIASKNRKRAHDQMAGLDPSTTL